MANSLISGVVDSLLGSAIPAFSATDDQTGLAIWTKLAIKNVEIDSSAASTIHPIGSEKAMEGGTLQSILSADIRTIKIIRPSALRITAFATSVPAIEAVISTFIDVKSTVTIKSRGIIVLGMAVSNIEIIQSPDMLSAAKMIIDMEQTYLPVAQSGFDPSSSINQTVKSAYGVIVSSANSLTSNVTSVYNKILKSISF